MTLKKENINLQFLASKPIKYQQYSNEFIPWLCIIDVMMFNTPEEINQRKETLILSFFQQFRRISPFLIKKFCK